MRRRIVRSVLLLGAILGAAAPFLASTSGLVWARLNAPSGAGLLTVVVSVMAGAAYGWAVGELFVRAAFGQEPSREHSRPS